MRGETFEGKEAQGRYRHETRLDGRLRNNASRGCETPRAPRSWEGMPSARESGTQVTFERRSLRLQSKRRRAQKLQEGDQHELQIQQWIWRKRRSGNAATGRTTGQACLVEVGNEAEQHIEKDSEREGKDMKGRCGVSTTLHHLDDSTARTSVSQGRGGDIEPIRYAIIQAETL